MEEKLDKIIELLEKIHLSIRKSNPKYSHLEDMLNGSINKFKNEEEITKLNNDLNDKLT